MYRSRLCLLGLVLSVYLAGVLFLSSVTLQDQIKVPKGFQNGIVATNRGRAMEIARGVGSRQANLHWCQPLKYITNSKSRPVIALVSFPGSGNTWLRYLLQQATGLYTGSVYKDYGLLKNGFPGESIVNNTVIVVKTHEWGSSARQRFDKAILLIRAPGPAILAEFNRQSGGHIGFASPDRYRRNKGKYWQQFVRDKLRTWRVTNLDWLQNFTGPIHIVLYEELVSNLEWTLRSLVDFLELSVSDSELKCAVNRREGIYKRKQRVFSLDPFTAEMKSCLASEHELVLKELQSYLKSS
uniref:Sulfotransferase domain-containing protein n=1 Tax=Clastoptera arizonana TaxID=38151 RepID=A0A1B6DAR1_9HEMI